MKSPPPHHAPVEAAHAEMGTSCPCPFCKENTLLPTLCSRCHRHHCATCRLTVGKTVLCPHCILLLVKRRTVPKPVSEWQIFGNHYIRCDRCRAELKVRDKYDQIRIRENCSIWCASCCEQEPSVSSQILIVDASRQGKRK